MVWTKKIEDLLSVLINLEKVRMNFQVPSFDHCARLVAGIVADSWIGEWS